MSAPEQDCQQDTPLDTCHLSSPALTFQVVVLCIIGLDHGVGDIRDISPSIGFTSDVDLVVGDTE